MRKLNLHWFCTQNHILEPFSVRHACTQCYVRKKIVIVSRWELRALPSNRAIHVEGGGGHYGPPPSLIKEQAWRVFQFFHMWLSYQTPRISNQALVFMRNVSLFASWMDILSKSAISDNIPAKQRFGPRIFTHLEPFWRTILHVGL